MSRVGKKRHLDCLEQKFALVSEVASLIRYHQTDELFAALVRYERDFRESQFMTELVKRASLWQHLSFDERAGTAAISIYIMCILNWFSCRYGFGGIDFASEKVKAWVDLTVAVLPILWLLTSKSKRPRAIDWRLLGMISFACLFLFSFLNFFIRSTPDPLIRETKVDCRTSTKLYENGGSALDMPSRYEQAETVLLPGIKWVRVIRIIGWLQSPAMVLRPNNCRLHDDQRCQRRV